MTIKYAIGCALFGLVLAAPAVLSAQTDNEYDDLRTLYIDEKYEKLISKGERYIGKSDAKKDPAPYLYLAKAYYEISRAEDMHEEWPPEKAFANALKWAVKYRKKDPEGILFRENDLFFEELKKTALGDAAGQMSDQKYSRAKRFYDSITKFDPENIGAYFLLGLCQMEMRSTTEANMTFKQGDELLRETDVTRMNALDKKTLRDGGIAYAEFLIAEGRRDDATETLDLLAPALAGDSEFDMLYRKVK